MTGLSLQTYYSTCPPMYSTHLLTLILIVLYCLHFLSISSKIMHLKSLNPAETSFSDSLYWTLKFMLHCMQFFCRPASIALYPVFSPNYRSHHRSCCPQCLHQLYYVPIVWKGTAGKGCKLYFSAHMRKHYPNRPHILLITQACHITPYP